LISKSDLQGIFEYIDRHKKEHIEKVKELVRVPSIAAENPEGIKECSKVVKKYFDELGCVDSEIFQTRGQPVVYGHYDAHAKNTLAVYLMYDVKQVAGEKWSITDPFDPQEVELAPFRSVLIGRGTVNTKGPMMAFLNALNSIKACGHELPVNLKFVAEGEEELGSVHLIDFLKARVEKFKDSQACLFPSSDQEMNGKVEVTLGCKGVAELELECSGELWGRGPVKRGIHSSVAPVIESPMWRMTQALASMTDSADPDRVLIAGFYDNVARPTIEEIKIVEKLAQTFDEENFKKEIEVNSFTKNLRGKDLLMKMLFSTSLNIQGISGGYEGPLFKTILPNRIIAKLESRLVPNQTREETAKKIRAHLEKLGYSDIAIREYPEENGVDDWSRTDPNSGVVRAVIDSYRKFGYEPEVWPTSLGSAPFSLFTKYPLRMPLVSAGLGFGARAHAPDEYYVIEGNDKVQGLTGAEKFFVSSLFDMSEGKLN
jgi:acetylornithine deacetylase/succinyl-diaminopimelate desuccinylase-like protein